MSKLSARGAGPTPPRTSSRAVSSLPKLFEALLQRRGRHAQQPACSSHVLTPRLLGLECLPAALPLQKMPPAPCSHPLTTAWLSPCGAAGPCSCGCCPAAASLVPSRPGAWSRSAPGAPAPTSAEATDSVHPWQHQGKEPFLWPRVQCSRERHHLQRSSETAGQGMLLC